MLNICRPAALRQYYRKDTSSLDLSMTSVKRYTYGYSSANRSVAMNTTNFVTKPFNIETNEISLLLTKNSPKNRGDIIGIKLN